VPAATFAVVAAKLALPGVPLAMVPDCSARLTLGLGGLGGEPEGFWHAPKARTQHATRK